MNANANDTKNVAHFHIDIGQVGISRVIRPPSLRLTRLKLKENHKDVDNVLAMREETISGSHRRVDSTFTETRDHFHREYFPYESQSIFIIYVSRTHKPHAPRHVCRLIYFVIFNITQLMPSSHDIFRCRFSSISRCSNKYSRCLARYLYHPLTESLAMKCRNIIFQFDLFIIDGVAAALTFGEV